MFPMASQGEAEPTPPAPRSPRPPVPTIEGVFVDLMDSWKESHHIPSGLYKLAMDMAMQMRAFRESREDMMHFTTAILIENERLARGLSKEKRKREHLLKLVEETTESTRRLRGRHV